MARRSVPTWYVDFVSNFPLLLFGKAVDRHTEHLALPSRPTLYIAGAHPKMKKTAEAGGRGEGSSTSVGWASRDPECLTWQMMMLFSVVSVHCEQIDPFSPFAKDYPGEAFAEVPVLVDCNGARVLRKGLAAWIEASKGQKEAEKGHEPQWRHEAVLCLLQGPLEAAVLLELSLQPALERKYRSKTPLLSRRVEDALRDEKARCRRAFMSSKHHHSPMTQGPSWSTTMHGILRGGVDAILGSLMEAGPDFGNDDRSTYAFDPLTSLDVESIRRTACNALAAIAKVSFPQGDENWIGGASGPSYADAKLFALLHTLLSLPTIPQHLPSSCLLRDFIRQNDALSSYAKRIWHDYVRPMGG